LACPKTARILELFSFRSRLMCFYSETTILFAQRVAVSLRKPRRFCQLSLATFLRDLTYSAYLRVKLYGLPFQTHIMPRHISCSTPTSPKPEPLNPMVDMFPIQKRGEFASPLKDLLLSNSDTYSGLYEGTFQEFVRLCALVVWRFCN